jgi:hypothetical protein
MNYCGGDGGSPFVFVELVEGAPKPPVLLSITSGVSGFMLSINFSMGTACGGGAGVLADVLASG